MPGSQLYRELLPRELEAVVAAHLPGSFEAEKLQGGLFNTTYRIAMADGRCYVLRMGPVNRHLLLPYEENLMQGEMLFYHLARTAGIPTSEVVACQAAQGEIDRDYMLVRYIESLPLSSKNVPQEQRPALYRQAGMYTARLNRISGDQFGRLADIAAGRGCASWNEWLLREMMQWQRKAAAMGVLTAEERQEAVELFVRNVPLMEAVTTPCLVHADLWDGNVLVRPAGEVWEVAAIIDGDRAVFGDAEFELASGWMVNEDFLAGYGAQPADDPASCRRRMLYKLLYELSDVYIWRVEYDSPEESEKHLANARRLMAMLKA